MRITEGAFNVFSTQLVSCDYALKPIVHFLVISVIVLKSIIYSTLDLSFCWNDKY